MDDPQKTPGAASHLRKTRATVSTLFKISVTVPPWLVPVALLLSHSPRTQNQQATVTDRGTSLQDARPLRA